MDANASIQITSAVASAYAQSAGGKAKVTQDAPQLTKSVRKEDSYQPSSDRKSKELGAPADNAASNLKGSVTNSTDRLELSTFSHDLSSDAKVPKQVDTRSDPKPDDPEEASKWSQDRLARLDHLALLVKEGHYRIEPFMVDEIALRLARAMASI